MNRAEWQRVEPIFVGALERPAPSRAAYLDEACAGEPELRRTVDALLAQHDAASDFLEPIVDLQRGGGDATHIGAYRIVRELGSGGMGIVYLAMHEGPDFERAVALKVIRRGLDTEDVLRRFRIERRILAALAHPNVAHLLDAGQTPDGRPFFVMQFVEGVPIDAYCDREKLSVADRLRLVQKVCDAVQHAHANLVVHRDLKPSNILVTAEGSPVLLDFGIGKLMDDQEGSGGSTTTGPGGRAFTPDYAAPEQLRGEPVSTATDVYGLGLLLYRLLAGRRAFDHLASDDRVPPRPSAHGNRQLAGDLDTIVLKALRPEPERRYASVAALSDDIQRHLDGLPVRARPDTFGYRAGKFARRHALALSAGSVVFVSLVGATAYSRTQTRAVTRERDKAIEVQTFLLEMFGSTGPGRSDSVSVRQLLTAQAASVNATYAGRPELQAQMQMAIGEGFDRLGLFAPAESLFTRALDTRRRVLPARHADIAVSAAMLGWVAFERGRADEGEALLREAITRWPAATPYNPAMHARAMNDLGVVLESRGRYDEAIDLYRQTLATRRRLFGDTNRAVAVTGSNLSMALARKGDFRAAVATAETALAVMRKSAGPDHQRSTLIQGNLATLRSQLGDVDGAEREYRDLVARQTRVSGMAHPVTAQSRMNLASILRTRGKLAEAESMLVQSLASFETAYGPEHNRVGVALTALGGLRSAMGRHAEARAMLQRAVAIQTKARGEAHRETANAISALAMSYGDAGDWATAEREHRRALAAIERAMGPTHLETATLRSRLALAVARRGRRSEAADLYRQSLDAMLAAGVKETSPARREIEARIDSLRR